MGDGEIHGTIYNRLRQRGAQLGCSPNGRTPGKGAGSYFLRTGDIKKLRPLRAFEVRKSPRASPPPDASGTKRPEAASQQNSACVPRNFLAGWCSIDNSDRGGMLELPPQAGAFEIAFDSPAG